MLIHNNLNGSTNHVDDIGTAKWQKRAAECGDVDSMNAIAVLYEQGKGVPQDVDQAIQMFLRAGD